jgi:putative copper resistance protein D
MFLWGTAAYLAVLVSRDLAADVWRRLRRTYVVAVAAAALSSLLSLPVETALIGNGWQDAFSLSTVGDVLQSTTVGQAWLVQLAASVGLVASLALTDSWQLRIASLAAALLLVGTALTGHAAMQEGWLGIAHRANDALHLLAAGAWLGALVPLAVILAGRANYADRLHVATALRRFSAAGQGIVAVVVATGVLNTALTLGHPPTDWSSPYQALLGAKIILVGAMIAFAVANRYAFVPDLAGDRERAMAALRRGTIAETALGAIVVGLVAVFGMLDPM